MAELFIAYTPDMHYGIAETPKDALANAKKAGGRIGGDRAVYRLPKGAENAWVDQMGAAHWEYPEDMPEAERKYGMELVPEFSRGV